MAHTVMGTQVTGYVVTASDWNEIVNNFIAGATDAMTADGDIWVGTGANAGVKLAAFTGSTGTLKHESGGLEFDVSAITTGGLLRGASAGAIEILTVGTNGQILTVVSGEPAWAAGGAVATGTYTGDDATSQAITGVGFQVKFLIIWQRETGGASAENWHMTSDLMVDNSASGLSWLISGDAGTSNDQAINQIIALGSDGFTVDDAGSNSHPNANSQVYEFVAWG